MMASTPQPGVPLVLRRKGFTLIELLVVMAIIAILITILIMGVSSMSKSSHEKATRTDMENLKSLMVEAANQGAMDKIYNLYSPVRQTDVPMPSPPYYPNGRPLPALYPGGAVIPVPGDVRDGAKDRTPTFSQPTPPIPSNEVARTWLVMNLLRSAGTNAQMMAKMPSDALMSAKEANSVAKLATPPAAAIPLDGWGNPMIFVPGGGVNVTVSDPKSPGGVGTRTVTAPDGKGFWASAGPDGVFTDTINAAGSQKAFGDDNVYSFEN